MNLKTIVITALLLVGATQLADSQPITPPCEHRELTSCVQAYLDRREEVPDTIRHWYVKTNLPAWGMLISNVAFEINGDKHWSFMLPIYYSGWNYFIGHLKFRTFTILPEVRYWLKPENEGFFFGVHGGFAYYNVAFNGEKRYQDHDKTTPALGGGINAGYRLDISQNKRWKLEFSLGCGVYHLDYDKFINRVDGLRIEREKRTFFGIDNFAVSIAYQFDIRRNRK